MSFTSTFYEHINKQESNDAELWLLRFTAPDAQFEPLFLAANTEDIISNGQLYSAFPFDVVLADENSDQTPTFNLILSNVTLELIQEIKSVSVPIQLELDLILGSDPDTVEIALKDLKVSNVEIQINQLNMSVIYDDILNVQVPSYFYDPQSFRTLF